MFSNLWGVLIFQTEVRELQKTFGLVMEPKRYFHCIIVSREDTLLTVSAMIHCKVKDAFYLISDQPNLVSRVCHGSEIVNSLVALHHITTSCLNSIKRRT